MTASNVVTGNLVATSILGPIEGSNTVSASVMTASNVVTGNLVATSILGPIEGSNTVSASVLTASNVVTGNLVSSSILGPIEGSNTVSASVMTASNVVTGNLVASSILGPIEGSNTVSASVLTASNVVTGNLVASSILGPIEGSNLISASVLTVSNVVAGNLVASSILGPIEGSNLISASVLTVSNVATGNLVASSILGSIEGSNTISASAITSSNVVTGNLVASSILGPIEGSNIISASVLTVSNVLVDNVTANLYFGDGGLLSNIATTLQAVTDNGNVSNQVVQFTNPTTAFTTDLTSNILVNLTQMNDVTVTTPSNDHVLVYTGGEWVNQYPNHNYVSVKNVSGGQLDRGTVVYVIGTQNANIFNVDKADASDPSKMPAIGIVYSDLANGTEGVVVAYGKVQGVPTNGFLEGEVMYLSNTSPGAVSNVKSYGLTDLIQNIGICTKSHATNGTVFVTGVGRSNDIPNAPLSASPNYVYINEANNDMKKIVPSDLLTKIQTFEQVSNVGNTTSNVIQFTAPDMSLVATGNISVGGLKDPNGINQYLTMVDTNGDIIQAPAHVEKSTGKYIITAAEAEFLGNITLSGNKHSRIIHVGHHR